MDIDQLMADALKQAMAKPCQPYPEDASYKTIAPCCPRCNTWDCWRRYLSWEKSLGITLNEADHPAILDEDHQARPIEGRFKNET